MDLDGDGVPDEARAVTAVKDAGAAISGVAGSMRGKAAGLFSGKKRVAAADEEETKSAPDADPAS